MPQVGCSETRTVSAWLVLNTCSNGGDAVGLTSILDWGQLVCWWLAAVVLSHCDVPFIFDLLYYTGRLSAVSGCHRWTCLCGGLGALAEIAGAGATGPTVKISNFWQSKMAAGAIGNESAPIQLAQCRFPGLAISNAKILIYVSDKIHGSNFCQTPLGNCYGLKLPKCWLQFKTKFHCVIYYNFRHTFVPHIGKVEKLLYIVWSDVTRVYWVKWRRFSVLVK